MVPSVHSLQAKHLPAKIGHLALIIPLSQLNCHAVLGQANPQSGRQPRSQVLAVHRSRQNDHCRVTLFDHAA